MRLFHFTSKHNALLALAAQRLKVARIAELNDPFELLCVDLRDPLSRKAFQQFKEQTAERFGFLCFSRGWRNPLLWSHYGDKHLGVALEVEIDPSTAMPVKYLSSRPNWDAQAIVNKGGFTQHHIEVLTTSKSHHWSYEDEVRVAVSLAEESPDASGYYFSPVTITGVIAGARCDLTGDDVADVLPRSTSVTHSQARLAFREFDVIRRKDVPIRSIQGRR